MHTEHPRTPSGFTLIEILIAVTISALLFAWLITFVMSGLSSVGRTQKSVENSIKGSSFERVLETLASQESLQIVGTGVLPSEINSWVLLETKTNTDPYIFLGVQSFTGYCASDPTRVLQRLISISGTTPRNWEIVSVGGYSIDREKQSVFQGTTRVVGTLSSGDILSSDPLATELSSPSSLVLIGDILYIADTGNSRVLAYNTTSKSIVELIGAKEGILHPTSLATESGDLLIGWRNGLFRLHESTETGAGTAISLQSSNSLTFDSIAVSFSGISTLSQPASVSSINISGLTSWMQDPSDTVAVGTWLLYTFTWWARTQNPNTPINIRISDIAPAPTTPGMYVLSADLLLAGSSVYSGTFPYFTKSDNNPATRTGQIITRPSNESRLSLVTSSSVYTKGLIEHTAFLSGTGLTTAMSGSPVTDVQIQRVWNTLTLTYKNYDIYDCSPDEHHRLTTHVQKIWVRDPD